ncbi:MAG: penicillin-binding transpeptidase domain-containing protein [Oscillospiraceae bacterium]|nr:penicillin-binding transpeptidase domain-containing protein [Oscillospiraceae bacterium]
MWRRAMIVLIALTAIGFGAVVFSLIRIQLVQGNDLKKAATDQQLQDTQITAKRGTIYDCNGKILAQSASVWRVVLEPKYLLPAENDSEKTLKNKEGAREKIVTELAKILDIKEEDIQKKIDKGTYYEILKGKVETEERDQILQLKEELVEEYNQSSGILLESDYKRYYPYGTLASSVLGFVGSDGQGLSGLEAYYDSYLAGTSGRLVSVKNAVGTDMPFQYDQMVDAEDGYSLKLTLDETIQHILEKYLDEGVANNNVHNRATAICMNVKTGAILGLAVSGDYDPNDPYTITDDEAIAEIEKLPENERQQAESDALQAQWRNKAVSDTYYPGSVFKMVTLSSAFEENLVKENDTFTCNGYTQVEDRKINCWQTGGHGTETVEEGLMNSCNPMFMWLGFQLGKENFMDYFDGFGFTEKTGIDLPGESDSIYKGADKMNSVDLAVYSFGQNFSITPIQMVTACSAIANGGYLVQPYVVAQVMDSDGNIVKTTETTVKRQAISTETAKRVAKIMNRNATEGTAKNGYVAGYRICGKTGTSEKVAKYWSEGGSAKGAVMQYIASYCGFAPLEDPEVALLVFFDEPDVSGNFYGSAVAGPVFANMMSEILPYLGVEPQYTESEAEGLDTTAPIAVGESLSSAQTKITNAELNYEVYGSGDTVLAQSPEPGVAIPSGGTVVLFTDEESQKETVEVPDLVGLSYGEANDVAVSNGLQIKVTGVSASSGNAVSSAQSIAKGQKVKPGTVVTVNFITKDTVQ